MNARESEKKMGRHGERDSKEGGGRGSKREEGEERYLVGQGGRLVVGRAIWE